MFLCHSIPYNFPFFQKSFQLSAWTLHHTKRMAILNHRMHQKRAKFSSCHCQCTLPLIQCPLHRLDAAMGNNTTGKTGKINQADSWHYPQQAFYWKIKCTSLEDVYKTNNCSEHSFSDSPYFNIAEEAMVCFGERKKQLLRKRWRWKNVLYTPDFTKFQNPQNKVISLNNLPHSNESNKKKMYSLKTKLVKSLSICSNQPKIDFHMNNGLCL